ncbi:MAG TPA: APC family permease [Kofleriaceae bacterium]|nr:APC family permease [Kofleriaceae bacterium]
MTASPPRLLRVVGLAGLTAIALNGVVGAGIFVLPATVYRLAGAASPLAYVVAAVLMALVVACFAEAGSRSEETGGPYLYARDAFGELVGFLIGWLFFLTRLLATGAIANAFVAYLGYFEPALATGAGRVAAITVAVGGLAAVNVYGVRGASRTVNVFTIAKLLPLTVLIIAGLGAIDPARVALHAPPALGSLRQGALLLMFAYGGFENANVPTEEAVNPRRHLPIALLTTIAAVAVIYVLIQVVAQGVLPGLADSPTPLASAAREVLGAPGGWLLTVGAIVSTLGSISAVILVGPRLLYAFARHGQLPAALATIHPRHRSPHRAVIVFSVLVWAVAVFVDFARLAALSAVCRLLFSAGVCLAVPVLRRRQGAAAAAFVLPGGPLIPLLAVALSAWLLSDLSAAQATAGAIGIAAGFAVYAGQRWLRSACREPDQRR